MDDKRFTLFTGGFGSYEPPRTKSLGQSISRIQNEQTLNVKPGSSEYGFLEGPTTQFQHKSGNVWGQLYGESESGESTQYRELVKNHGVSDLTRANKALMRGGSDSLSPTANSWRGKSYSPSAMTTATLFRINETTTAFGSGGFNHTSTDVGTGIMAEVLHQKWSEKDAEMPHDAKRLLNTLESKFPQLVSVEGMRKQGEQALMTQVEESRFAAAVSAGNRGFNKGMESWQVNEYVQRKFAKHGLGPVPRGWMDEVTGKSPKRTKRDDVVPEEDNAPHIYSGAFHSYRPEQAKSLDEGIELTRQQRVFEIKPESSTFGFMEGPTTQIQYTKGEVWGQQIGQSRSDESTKYRVLQKKFNVSEFTRANKALVAGGGGLEDAKPNTWKDKKYTKSALTAATLVRINETTTAFGDQGFERPETNVGAGIMAETLHQKWSARNERRALGSKGLLNTLEKKYPQLKSVDDMRKQGAQTLKTQVETSRLSAAVSAGERALQKGFGMDKVEGYVQQKFAKHGLGTLPEGWGEQLQKRLK